MIFLRRTLIIILALIGCALIWYVGPLVAVGRYHPFYAVWIRVLLITVILFIVFWPLAVTFLSFLLQYLLRPWRQKPPPKKELDIVTSRFQDTVATLKNSALNDKQSQLAEFLYKIKKPYLEDRPWLLILGAAGAGKTSGLYMSGEQFLHSEHYGFAKTAAVGPTSVYNSWISRRAVYFDTGAEWLKLDGQREESAAEVKTFFKLIKKYRPNSGLDGIVLCLEASWLKNAPLNDLKSFADSLRLRLIEISKILGQDLPVYLFITKIDLLPGAKEFMYMFNERILRNGLGLSAPKIAINGRDTNYFTEFSGRYDTWLTELSDFLLDILHDSLNHQIRKQLIDFIENIGSLKAPLLSFAEQAFPNYPTGYAGYLHDIWFGSAISLQVNPEDDRDLKNLGVLYYPAFTRAIESRGILDSLTAAKKFKINRRRLLSYAAVGVLAAAALMVLVTKYSKEVDYISYVGEKFKEAKRIIKEVPLSSKVGDELLYAYAQLDYINSQLPHGEADNKFNFAQDKLDPYIEHILLNDTLKKTYHQHLLKFFWPAVTNYVTDQLARDIRNDSPDVYGSLRVYQMFIKPEHRNAKDLINWFMKHWSEFAPGGYTLSDRKIFALHLKNLFEDDFAGQMPEFKPNNNLVNIAIIKAGNTPVTKRVFDKLREVPIPANVANISLVTAAGNNASLMLRHKDNRSLVATSIPAFYTRAAYQDIFLEHIDEVIDTITAELSWVLNENFTANRSKINLAGYKQRLKEDTVQYYLIAFTKQWKNFIDNITIRYVQNLEDSAFLAKQLADPASPIVNLIRFLHRELNLTGSADGSSGSWLGRSVSNFQKKRSEVIGELSGERKQYNLSPEKLVEDQFRSITDIGDKLTNSDDLSGNPVSKLFDDIYNLIYPLSLIVKNDPSAPTQEQAVFGQIQSRALTMPNPLKAILLDLISYSHDYAVLEIKSTVNNKMANMFTNVCRATIKAKYPFNRGATEDVSIEDFNRVFAPGGELETFFKQNNIENLMQNQTDSSEQFVDPKIMKIYKDYTDIRNSFFTNNKINFTFDLKPISLSANVFKADIDVGGQKLQYSHGYPTATTVSWPGADRDKANLIRLMFQTDDGAIKIRNFTGPWAIFRLLDAGKIIRSGPNYRVFSITLDGQYNMELEIKSDMDNFPLWNNKIDNFSCP